MEMADRMHSGRILHRITKRRLKMIILCLADYPIQSVKEVTKRFMELPRLPDHVKEKVVMFIQQRLKVFASFLF